MLHVAIKEATLFSLRTPFSWGIRTFTSGSYNAFGLQYRFAAADMAPADWKPKAISYTLAGGIIGGFIGPALGNLTRNAWGAEFMATYASLSAFALVALLIAAMLKIPDAAASAHAGDDRRPWREIARQPAFIVAVLAAAVGYGTMNLLMAATPLAMDVCGLGFGDVAFVLQWHVLGMYAPSFVTGDLIRRTGVLQGSTAQKLMQTYASKKASTLALGALTPVPSYAEGVRLLKAGQIDTLVADELLIPKDAAIALRPEQLTVEPYALMMRKGDRAFVDAVDRALMKVLSGPQARQFATDAKLDGRLNILTTEAWRRGSKEPAPQMY